MYPNQHFPNELNYQQPFQQTINNAFRKFSDHQIEVNIRQMIQQDMLREYDFIISECYVLLNSIYKFQGNSLTRDSNSVFLAFNGKNIANQIDNLEEVETELSTVTPRPVEIVKDTKNIVTHLSHLNPSNS